MVEALCDLKNDWIKFFLINREILVIREIFESLIDFVNVVGVIDGTYIKIKIFKESGFDYFS